MQRKGDPQTPKASDIAPSFPRRVSPVCSTQDLSNVGPFGVCQKGEHNQSIHKADSAISCAGSAPVGSKSGGAAGEPANNAGPEAELRESRSQRSWHPRPAPEPLRLRGAAASHRRQALMGAAWWGRQGCPWQGGQCVAFWGTPQPCPCTPVVCGIADRVAQRTA
jgi:hypothetical protein